MAGLTPRPGPDDAALSRPIGWWLKETDRRLDEAFDLALDGLTADRRAWQVLSTLARRPCAEADLLAALSPFDSAAAIQAVVADLRSRGWVAEAGEELSLTEEGTSQQAEMAPLVAEVRQKVITALPGQDYVTLVGLLQRLIAAL